MDQRANAPAAAATAAAGAAPAANGADPAATTMAIDTTYDEYEGDEEYAEYDDENDEEVEQPQPSRPKQYNRNARPPPRQVRDDDHVTKLKLNFPPFEGRYNPDAYLTWVLEVEQCFACVKY